MRDQHVRSIEQHEERRQQATLNLIASENVVSKEVLGALGSVFTNKYAEGYPGKRYYGGNEHVDAVERLCQSRALKLFGLSAKKWHVNVQPYSGSPANLAAYAALVPLGQKIMGLRLDMGGHLTHGHAASFTSKAWRSVPYSLDPKTELLDYKAIARLARQQRPKLIIAGFTAYSRVIDFQKFRNIADSIGAYLLVDMSHFGGLVAGRVYPSPFPYADVVMTTTHKTLRGPRAALLFANLSSRTAQRKRIDIRAAIDRAVFPGLQGGPHVNQIAAAAVALQEAAQPAFRSYARQVVKNAKALSRELQKKDLRIVSGGTDTHLFIVDTVIKGVGGQEASECLEAQGIIVNKNTIPFDHRVPQDPSGIRLGTPALTTRGMREKEMRHIGKLIAAILLERKNVRTEVRRLCRKFPIRG